MVYEIDFDTALHSHIVQGDTIWDIGANVGFCTKSFAHAVGEQRNVYAFESTPMCFEERQHRCAHLENTHLFNIALGVREAMLPLTIEKDPLSPLNTLLHTPPSDENTLNVSVFDGDTLRGQGKNILKI